MNFSRLIAFVLASLLVVEPAVAQPLSSMPLPFRTSVAPTIFVREAMTLKFVFAYPLSRRAPAERREAADLDPSRRHPRISRSAGLGSAASAGLVAALLATAQAQDPSTEDLINIFTNKGDFSHTFYTVDQRLNALEQLLHKTPTDQIVEKIVDQYTDLRTTEDFAAKILSRLQTSGYNDISDAHRLLQTYVQQRHDVFDRTSENQVPISHGRLVDLEDYIGQGQTGTTVGSPAPIPQDWTTVGMGIFSHVLTLVLGMVAMRILIQLGHHMDQGLIREAIRQSEKQQSLIFLLQIPELRSVAALVLYLALIQQRDDLGIFSNAAPAILLSLKVVLPAEFQT